ncbi:SPOR and LysM peptidoglycan-binding domain-containing protein [Moraxella marmotae]|uniref:SPOR and LysM peptidoglycan-binding domain-containing protein n=1 Tax=Moraxella marmotae TaxID=3344520 RepID=UPI0035F4F56A
MLGVALIVSGGLAFFALAKNNASDTHSAHTTQTADAKVAKPVVQPLTADVATEGKLLAEKQRQREVHTQQLKKQTDALLEEQNNARKQAIEKANAEAQGRNPANTQEVSADSAAKSELIAAPTVQTRPEAIEAAKKAEADKKAAEAEAAKKAAQAKEQKPANKPADDKKADKSDKTKEQKKPDTAQAKTDKSDKKADNKSDSKSDKTTKAGTHQVQQGESLTVIANRHGVSVAALAEANGMSRDDILRAGHSIKIPSSSQVARLERDAKARQANQSSKSKEKTSSKQDTQKSGDNKTDNKSDNKKSETKSQNPQLSGRYTVQVAISPDKEKVDEIVKQYRAAGYRVTTSNTSRGLRVLVGSEKSEADAKALRNKISNDSRVSSSGAFVHQAQ